MSSIPWLLVGNPWIITITTVWEIRRTGGAWASGATFYFKVFHRDSLWVETEIAVSNYTLPISNTTYSQFNTSALLNNWPFTATDRVVIKYYATKVWAGSNPSYEFLFGGTNPVRTLLPVPTSVLLDDYYTKTQTDDLLDTKQNLLPSPTTGVGSSSTNPMYALQDGTILYHSSRWFTKHRYAVYFGNGWG